MLFFEFVIVCFFAFSKKLRSNFIMHYQLYIINYQFMINKQVSILLAVYNPNYDWFRKQLISLNNQSYKNINLYVYDDCPENPFDEEYLKKYITNFKYKLIRGKENKGSNKAFEYLTKIADGDYFAYCDQDDIWETEKIEKMVDAFKDKDVTLAYCDLSIIDKDDKKIADSFTDIRKRIVYLSGFNQAQNILFSNFVTGCAMMVRSDMAKKAVPFHEMIVHDQWIAIIAALNGKIEFIKTPLIRYRQHNNNQTGILKDVYDKKSYYKRRIDDYLECYYIYKKRLSSYKEIKKTIDDTILWIESRKRYSKRVSFSDLKTIIKYRKFHKISAILDIVLPFIPDILFKIILKLAKKGII
ncbi:glycosyltransferase family 2 protein [Clostridium sp. BJN0001]|uniref:glycosyltransferase family 2 protein n=1 Tax=Clostridium sp. BJN0001 TaxID=2930219 RepID=UPI001FD4105B|nr:glycosyltransferase family 2 protein [Clostridium sp. BJN0001]